MKKLILFIALMANLGAIAQINFKTQIQGNWSYVDENAKTQKLIITKDNWETQKMIPSNEDSTKWSSFSLVGKYKFIRRKKIQIIYHDKPREQGFVKIIKVTENELIVKKSRYRFFLKSHTYKYSKE